MIRRALRSLARRLRHRNNPSYLIPSAILLLPFSEWFLCDSLVPMVARADMYYYYYEPIFFPVCRRKPPSPDPGDQAADCPI